MFESHAVHHSFHQLTLLSGTAEVARVCPLEVPGNSYHLLKVELEVNEVINILIIVVNRFDMSLDGHVLVAAGGRSQSIPKFNGG